MELTNLELKEKKDYLNLFHIINDPLKKYYSNNFTRIEYATNGVGYGNKIAGMEGASRVLWGAGPAIDKMDESWLKIIKECICNGTNSSHPDYWGDINDFDQRMVEMPAIAMALYHKNKFLWNQLSSDEQDNIVNWFKQILEHKCPDGNWQFFKVLVGKIIEKLGYEVDQEAISQALEKINACYISNGWYKDSTRGRQDYYNPFAFHYYGLIYSIIAPEDPNSEVFRNRAKEHAKDFLYFFDREGANIPFGRSLIYRHAAAAFWAALIFAGVYPYDAGEIKGILNRNIKWWMKHNIFDENGILSVGYTYAQLLVSDPYNGSLSAYWSNKIFLVLALDDDNEFWKIDEKDMPKQKTNHLIKKANLRAVSDNGHTYFLNAGQPGSNYHSLSNEKYLKFAYSSQFGFSIPRGGYLKEESAMDSMLGVQFSDVKIIVSKNRKPVKEVGPFLVRNQVEDVKLGKDYIESLWNVGNRVSIKTYLTDVNGWQVRIHKIKTNEEIVVYETGFAVGNAPENQGSICQGDNENHFCGENGFSGIYNLIDGITRNNCIVECNPNTNLMCWEKTCIPGFISTLGHGEHILVTGIYAHKNLEYAKEKWTEVPTVEFFNKCLIIKYKDIERSVQL